MRNSYRILIVAVFVLALGIGCGRKETFVDQSLSFAALGQGAEFSLHAVPGAAQFVVANFYAPDCPPCEKEVPALKAFAARHRADAAIRFVAIGSSLRAIGEDGVTTKTAISRDEIVRELQQFATKFSIDYPQYIADAAVLKAWRITGFPETFVFKRAGARWQLVRKYISEITLEELEKVTSGSGR